MGVGLVGAGVTVEASAQDYLGVHLDTQREANLRRHQQEAASKPAATPRKKYTPPISGKARHAAMRRHSREYGKIMQKQGYHAADKWLAEQVAAGR
ncbi:MAG: hypothetical protein AB7D33_05755 [Sphingobium sp.]